MRKRDLTNILTILIFLKFFEIFWQFSITLPIFNNVEKFWFLILTNFWQFWGFSTISKMFNYFDNFQLFWQFLTTNQFIYLTTFLTSFTFLTIKTNRLQQFFTILTIKRIGDLWHLRHWLGKVAKKRGPFSSNLLLGGGAGRKCQKLLGFFKIMLFLE